MKIESLRPNIQKEYKAAFLLDKAKLSRIINIMEDRFDDLQLEFKPIYSIELSQGNELNLHNIEDLFELDNTIRNPIKNLTIKASGKNLNNHTSLECCVVFGIKRISFDRRNLSLEVKSLEPKITLQVFAILEEQIQRVILDDWMYRIIQSRILELWFLPVSFIGLIPLLFLLSKGFHSLSNDTIQSLLAEANALNTYEQKIDFLFKVKKNELEKQLDYNSGFDLSSLINVKTFFVLLPIAIILVCFIYIISKCYPANIFLWGDYEAYYNRLVARRNTLWTVVILSIILGIITNFFIIGISDFLR
ncbi:hypothetical protein [Trichothermofontia sp.]